MIDDNIKTVYIDPSEKEEKLGAFLVLFAITCLEVAEEDRLLVAQKAKEDKYKELKLLAVRDSWLYYVRGLYNSHFRVSKDQHLFKLLLDELPPLYRDIVIQHCHDVLGEALNECLFSGVQRIIVLDKKYIVPCRSCILLSFVLGFSFSWYYLYVFFTVIVEDLQRSYNNSTRYKNDKAKKDGNEGKRKRQREGKSSDKVRVHEPVSKAQKSLEKVCVVFNDDSVSGIIVL